MCDTDIGDHTDVRTGYRRETAHLTEMIDTHLKDRNFCVLRHIEDGDRKSPFVIEVAKCFVYVIFLSQNGCDHLFGAGLSNTSGNSDNLHVERITVKLGNVEQCLACGFYQDIREIRLTEIFV